MKITCHLQGNSGPQTLQSGLLTQDPPQQLQEAASGLLVIEF